MNSSIIKLLPEHIANQIAAGEVVVRPAAVVKELLENSIDAGADRIQLIVKEAGKELIQVVDNGKGMSDLDALMAFERHATSKISEVDDIYRIASYGFRGEALASIAAVAKVELRTRTKAESTGTMVRIEAGEVVVNEPMATPVGTHLSVKNLFYNVPARRNFLKSDNAEMKAIREEFIKTALAWPEVHMSLVSNGTEVYAFAAGSAKQRIMQVYDKKIEDKIVRLTEHTDIVHIEGYIGTAALARKSRDQQQLFVNRRPIKSNYLSFAIQSAYERLLPAGTYPFFVLNLEVAFDRIDVNIHPAKTEVRFMDEKSIFLILQSGIRKALGSQVMAGALDFENEDGVVWDKKVDSKIHLGSGIAGLYKPEQGERPYGNSGGASPSASDRINRSTGDQWKELYNILQEEANEAPSEANALIEQEEENAWAIENQQPKPVLQLGKKYVVTTLRSGLMLVHQQLAHSRVLFDLMIKKIGEGAIASQQMMFPSNLSLNADQHANLKQLQPQLKKVGYQLEHFGQYDWLLTGVPEIASNLHHEELIVTLLEQHAKTEWTLEADLLAELCKTIADGGAIRVGQSLGMEEMHDLIGKLFASENPYFSPSGKAIMITIPTQEIDKKFR